VAKLLLQGPSVFLLGLGPFSYSNPIGMGQTLEGRRLAGRVEKDLIPDSIEPGEDTRVTLATSAAVELGVPALIVPAFLYWRIWSTVHACIWPGPAILNEQAANLTAALTLILGTGLLAQFGSISAISLTVLTMLLAGATCRLAARRPAACARGELS
jgi:hypothetical protein